MPKFRKKPVEIEAWLFDGSWRSARPIVILDGNMVWRAGVEPAKGTIEIDTLEGRMTASPGDWVIRGMQGEFYPCKPAIFAAIYDPV